METNEKENKILLELLSQYHKNKKWVNAKRFRADFSDEIKIIDDLIKNRFIEWNISEGILRITFKTIYSVENDEFTKIFKIMDKIFNELKESYKKDTESSVKINDIAKNIKSTKESVVEGAQYLLDILPLGRSIDMNADDAFLHPGEDVVRFKTFYDLVDDKKEEWLTPNGPQEEPTKLRHSQLAKLLCQAIAKTLWDEHPKMTISEMCSHKAIQDYGGGAPYSKEKTLRSWLSEVDLRDKKSKTGRPKKNRK